MFLFLAKFALFAVVTITSAMGVSAVIDKAIPHPTPIPSPYPFVVNPTPFIPPTYSPKPTQQPYQTTIVTTPKIDCVGPDGKHLQVTQKECDDFNKAWNTNGATKSQTDSNPAQLILNNAQVNVNSIEAKQCVQKATDEDNQCTATCLSTSNYETGVCQYARDNNVWTSDRYDECKQEVYGNYKSCLDSCLSTMNSKSNACLQIQIEANNKL